MLVSNVTFSKRKNLMRGDKLMEGVLFIWKLKTQISSTITHSVEIKNTRHLRIFLPEETA